MTSSWVNNQTKEDKIDKKPSESMSLCCQSLTDLADDELNLPKVQFITTTGGCFHCILATCQIKAKQNNNCKVKRVNSKSKELVQTGTIRYDTIQARGLDKENTTIMTRQDDDNEKGKDDDKPRIKTRR
jgi:hypothetical protein